MDFPANCLPIGRPQTLGNFNIASELDRRFRLSDTMKGQTVSLPLPIFTAAQCHDFKNHFRTVGLLSSWKLPAAVWVGRAVLPTTVRWRYASAPSWELLPGGLWQVTGVELVAMD
jgi:hypothetical protein